MTWSLAQSAVTTTISASTTTLTFPNAQTAGNLNVAILTIFDAAGLPSITGYTDTELNGPAGAYKQVAASLLVNSPPDCLTVIYYAWNIAAAGAGANTVTLSGSFGTGPAGQLTIAEFQWSGGSLTNDPLRAGNANSDATGSTTPVQVSIAGVVTTDLVVAGAQSDNGQTAAGTIGGVSANLFAGSSGTGFVSEWLQATVGGTVVATSSPNDDNWFMGAAAFSAPVPTINTQPSNARCQISVGTATFTVSATSSGGSLSYQWKVNGSNVTSGTGGTTASYTTATGQNITNNGDQYTVIVTDSNGSVTSNAAILTTFWLVTGTQADGPLGSLAIGELPPPSPPTQNPQARYSDVGTGRPYAMAAHIFATSNIPAPIVSAPPPMAIFPDGGTGKRTANGVHLFETEKLPNPASFQPSPSPSYPDRGLTSPWRAFADLAQQKPAAPLTAPNPQALYPDRGGQDLPSVASMLALAEILFPPAIAPPISTGSFPDKGNGRPVPVDAHLPATEKLPNPAALQPTPSGSWPDVGNARPVPRSAHDPQTPNIPDPATFRPAPRAVYPDRGYAHATALSAHDLFQVWFPVPPAQVPSGSWPDRGTGKPVAPSVHLTSTPSIPNPATFQPNPEAVYPDRGFGRAVALNAHDLFVRFLTQPPTVPPPAIYSDRQWDQPHRAHVASLATAFIPNPALLQPTPSAIFTDRPESDPTGPGVHQYTTYQTLGPVDVGIQSAIYWHRSWPYTRNHESPAPYASLLPPPPSPSYPDRGHAVATTASAHLPITQIPFVPPPPPPIQPSAIYPHRQYAVDRFTQPWLTSWHIATAATPLEQLFATLFVTAQYGVQLGFLPSYAASVDVEATLEAKGLALPTVSLQMTSAPSLETTLDPEPTLDAELKE